MSSRVRDGLLALAATAALVFAAPRVGIERAALLATGSLVAAGVGACGALAIELAMARDPETAVRLWADRRVRWGGTLLVAAGGPLVALVGGPAAGRLAVAALLGGLATYFGLLAGVLSGAVPPPETWFE